MVLLTVEVYRALLDQGLHYPQVFPQVGEGFSEVEPVGVEHLRVMTGPDAEAEAARGQMGDNVGLLGDGNRVAGPGGDDGRAEEDGLGLHGRHGQQGYGICVPARGSPGSLDAQLFKPFYLTDDFGRVPARYLHTDCTDTHFHIPLTTMIVMLSARAPVTQPSG